VDETAIPTTFTAAYILLKPALPTWESAHAQHLWLEPQRTNLIVNPSFEAPTDVGVPGWRYSGTHGEQFPGGVDLHRPLCGHFTDPAPIIVESNYFPALGTWLSFSTYLSVAAIGTQADITFGLVGFDASYTRTTFYCSDTPIQSRIIGVERLDDQVTFVTDGPHGYFTTESVLIEDIGPFNGSYSVVDVPSDVSFTISLPGSDVLMEAASGRATVQKQLHASGGSPISGFLQYQGMIQTPVDTIEMCMRIEVTGASEIWIDNAMVDPHEGQFGYFDGNSIDSFPDDYRWMGGRTNRHFSCWYSNYLNTHNRLFSDWDENEQRYKAGLVEEWAPTGASIIDHWDAVTSFTPLNWAGDAYYPVNEVAGTPLTTPTSRVSFKNLPLS